MTLLQSALRRTQPALLGAAAVLLLGGGGTVTYATVASHTPTLPAAATGHAHAGSDSTDSNSSTADSGQNTHGAAVSAAAQSCPAGKGHGACVEDVATNRTTLPSQAQSAAAKGETANKGK